MAFVKVLEVDDLPTGQGTTVTIGGRDYGVFHVGEEFYCIDNACPHHDGPLGEGDLEDDVVICPWHAWQVNVKTGEVLYASHFCVATYPCKAEEGAVWINV